MVKASRVGGIRTTCELFLCEGDVEDGGRLLMLPSRGMA